MLLFFYLETLCLTQVHRAALWILGEYCERTSDMQALMSAIRQVTLTCIYFVIFSKKWNFDNFCAQSLGEIPMVEDELRKAAGTEENVDESLAAGPTQQVRFWNTYRLQGTFFAQKVVHFETARKIEGV